MMEVNAISAQKIPPWILEPEKNLVLNVDFSLKRTVWLVFGWQGIDELEALMRNVTKCSKVVVMVNPKVEGLTNDITAQFETLIKEKSWGPRRIALISGDLSFILAEAANGEIDRDLYDQWKPVVTRRFAEVNGAQTTELIREIAKIFNSRNLEHSTRKNITSHFVKNLLLNFATISCRYSLADVQGKLKNCPAVVVAAGPSLNKQLPTLKKFQHLLTLIAVDSVWSVLKQHDITPDIVVALDTFNKPSWTAEDFDAQTLLVIDVGCNQSMFESVASPMLVTSNHPVEADLCATLGAPVDAFPSGGSVATKAFNLAVAMDANPIIFVGQDLAYTDGKDHADGYQYSDGYEAGLRVERAALGFDVEGYYGGRLRTERQFMHYKNWFESRIRGLDPTTLVINCTEGGARIDGTVQLPLVTVCNELASVLVAKPRFHDSSPSRHEVLSVTDRCVAVDGLRRRLHGFRRLASDGLDQIRRNGMKTLAKTLHKIDKINLRLQTSDPQIKYLVDTFACEELQRVRRITVRDDRSEDTGKISLCRYQEIYESIETAADKLDSALQKLHPYIEGRNCVGSKLDSEAAARVWQVT